MFNSIINALGKFVGILELFGLKYPVKSYMREVTPDLWRGSRLESQEQYTDLYSKGFKLIINLCAESDLDTQCAIKAGIQPIRLKIIDNTAPSLDQVQTFLVLTSIYKCYVHCEAGKGRTGTMCAIYRIVSCGWPLEKALDEAQELGPLVPCQVDFIKDHILAITANYRNHMSLQ